MRFTSRILLIGALFVGCSASLQAAEVDITPDVVYGHKHGMALTFDVFRPQGDTNGAGLLFMVSGGWRSRWGDPARLANLFEPLIERGFTVFAVRHGSSPKYNIPEIVEDVRRSVRYVRHHADELGVDPDRLGVFGGSAGGHLSLVLGTAADQGDADASDPVLRESNRVAAVVAYYPPTDLVGLVPTPPAKNERYPALNFDPERAKDYSPVWHASSDDPPTLLIHGDSDRLVPLAHSRNMIEAFEEHGVPCELIVIEGAGHGFDGEDGVRASTALADWFEQHLAAAE